MTHNAIITLSIIAISTYSVSGEFITSQVNIKLYSMNILI